LAEISRLEPASCQIGEPLSSACPPAAPAATEFALASRLRCRPCRGWRRISAVRRPRGLHPWLHSFVP